MSPSEFWDMTPAEVTIVLNAVAKREARDAKERQALIYAQAVLFSIGVSNPAKFPSFEEAFAADAPKEASGRDNLFAVKAWVARQGGRIN